MNELKKQLFKSKFFKKAALCRSFIKFNKYTKKQSLGVLKIHTKTELLAYKLLPQKRHQHLFKNNDILYISLPQKRHHLFQNNYTHIAPSKKTSLLKLFFFNLLYQNHQKEFLGLQVKYIIMNFS